MPDTKLVSDHYTHGSLLDAIRNGVERLGKSPGTVRVEDLAPIEEFHIGGRAASESFLDQLHLSSDDHVLDVGCGLGGTSRFVAHRYGSRVTGIDLTPEFIETGQALCAWVGLEHRIVLEHGDATALSYANGTFDKAYMMHVGMNIADKPRLMAGLHRVLKPGAALGIYDIMRTGDGDLSFPVPWASTAEASFVVPLSAYKSGMNAAGFRITTENNRRAFAMDFFARLQENTVAAGGPPPLGLHILMGETAPVKIKNMIENISEGRIAPLEIIAEKLSQQK